MRVKFFSNNVSVPELGQDSKKRIFPIVVRDAGKRLQVSSAFTACGQRGGTTRPAINFLACGRRTGVASLLLTFANQGRSRCQANLNDLIPVPFFTRMGVEADGRICEARCADCRSYKDFNQRHASLRWNQSV